MSAAIRTIIVTEEDFMKYERQYFVGRGYLITPHIFRDEAQFNEWHKRKGAMKFVEPGAKGKLQVAIDHRGE